MPDRTEKNNNIAIAHLAIIYPNFVLVILNWIGLTLSESGCGR
jgi:hypothetical protein